MARLAFWLFVSFLVLALVGWASTSHVVFEVIRFLSIASLMTSILIFIVLYVRTPDVPGGDRP